MINRCKICGTPVNGVSVCNYCRTAREERRFFKMVTREELREARIINKIKKSDLSKKIV